VLRSVSRQRPLTKIDDTHTALLLNEILTLPPRRLVRMPNPIHLVTGLYFASFLHPKIQEKKKEY
jgi:hypothetical protein